MSIAGVTAQMAGASPRLKARLAGVSYLLAGTTSAFSEFMVLGRLVVSGNAAATAHNIFAHQALFWVGFTCSLIAVALHLVWMVLFYDLFIPVNRSLSFLAACFLLVGCTLLALSSLIALAAFAVLGGDGYLRVFTVDQLHALALLLLNVNVQAYNIFLVCFGFYLLLIGCLIVRSDFLPRLLGVLVALAGLGYLTLLSPPLANALYPYFLAPAVPGELSLQLWLLIVGLNVRRWKEQATASAASLLIW